MTNYKSIWDEFTNKYSLSKTLRFELKPVGKDGKLLEVENAKKLFADIIKKDKEIKASYLALKPVMDKIHESIINKGLNSKDAKNINFSNYFEKYKKKGKKTEKRRN